MMLSRDEMNRRFTYHPPKDGDVLLYECIRHIARDFAMCVNDLCPDGREKSIAMTHLEDAVMWANASIARRQDADEEDGTDMREPTQETPTHACICQEQRVLRVKRVNPDAPLPKYAKPGDAGLDLCSMETVEIPPQGIAKVSSGIRVAIPDGYYGALVPRSGMATKRGITLVNTPGTIDAGYRGDVIIPLYNASTETQVVEAGERVCQLIAVRCAALEVTEVDELDETDRGDTGFGSSGTR